MATISSTSSASLAVVHEGETVLLKLDDGSDKCVFVEARRGATTKLGRGKRNGTQIGAIIGEPYGTVFTIAPEVKKARNPDGTRVRRRLVKAPNQESAPTLAPVFGNKNGGVSGQHQ